MSSTLEKSQLKDQYSTPEKVKARWNIYEYTSPKTNLIQEAINKLDLKGNETILDIGCGDGNFLSHIKASGHKGKLAGLDTNEKMFHKNKQEGIEFIVGGADKLSFPDKSIDIIIAFFMLYHMPNIQKTLHEWNRVLKIEGKLIISTSSQENRAKHKKFRKEVEKIIKSEPFPKFSSKFNLRNGKRQLEKVFRVDNTFIYEREIIIKDSKIYMETLNSIKNFFNPSSEKEWTHAMEVIKQKVEDEIKQTGYFTDNMKRGFFLCSKRSGTS
ncbi:MAG: methyltransferase domain-containing protein [Nanoarchaeota archaeon]|nr:methyltransferase domain-containing protein [Nanoarchaeota archaeon]